MIHQKIRKTRCRLIAFHFITLFSICVNSYSYSGLEQDIESEKPISDVQTEREKEAQNIISSVHQDIELRIKLKTPKKEKTKTHKRITKEEQESSMDNEYADHLYRVFHCLGMRAKKHENGVLTLLSIRDLLNRLFTKRKSGLLPPNELDLMTKECKEVIKQRNANFSKRIKPAQLQFFLSELSKDNFSQPETKKLLIAHFKDHTLFCGDRIPYEAWATFFFGPGIGVSSRVCMDPFGVMYQITSPFIGFLMGFGFGVTRTLSPEHEVYGHGEMYDRPAIGRVFENWDLAYEATFGIGIRRSGPYQKLTHSKMTLGLSLGMRRGPLALELNFKTPASPLQYKPKKVMATIDSFLAH